MKTVVITGSARGLGYNMARFFREKNYNVVISDLNEEKLIAAKENLEKCSGEGKVAYKICNVSKIEELQELMNYSVSEFEMVDIWINNAGVNQPQKAIWELSEGEVRIVLEWGAAPTDLDSHLIGSTDSGTDCHVYFVNMTCSNGDGTVAELDLDDTSSYGPETTTIHNINGKYNFAVNNYTPSTGSLSESGATVTVYLPGQSPAHFSVGSDGSVDGDWWYVCTIDHGVLKSYDG